MLDFPQTLDVQYEQAAYRASAATRPGRYLVSSMMAGMFIGIAVILMLSVAGPFGVAGSPATRLVAGAVFSMGLVLVVFAGAELVTSAMMILTQGTLSKTIKISQALGTLVFCFVGNFLGSIVFAWVAVQSGVLTANADAGTYLATVLDGKVAASGSELFIRGILCNIMVCLSVWCVNRCQTEVGKATVIFWCILPFVCSGYEHVVANMTTFSLGLFMDPGLTTWGEFGRNVLIVGLGNLVGGTIFVGVVYWFVARPVPEKALVR